jgi:hypothetical protein
VPTSSVEGEDIDVARWPTTSMVQKDHLAPDLPSFWMGFSVE